MEPIAFAFKCREGQLESVIIEELKCVWRIMFFSNHSNLSLTRYRFFNALPVSLVKDNVLDPIQLEPHFDAKMNKAARSCDHNILKCQISFHRGRKHIPEYIFATISSFNYITLFDYNKIAS